MIYGQRLRQYREYCSGRCLSLDLGSLARQLQPLARALRYDDTAVPGYRHDGESAYSRFPKSSKHCMA
jgi:hypothetical protein